MRTSAEIRDELIKILELDLVGPWPGHERENEILDRPPSREYLTGFIVPYEPPDGPARPQLQLTGEDTEQEVIGEVRGAGLDDDQSPEAASSRRAYFPSSLGISVLVPKEAKSIKVTVLWGDYEFVPPRKRTTKVETANDSNFPSGLEAHAAQGRGDRFGCQAYS